MRYNEDELLERLKSIVFTGKLRWQHVRSPVTESDVMQAEAMIGFALPSLLKRPYLEIGNGGFGPGDGLYPLNNEEDPKALHKDVLYRFSYSL